MRLRESTASTPCSKLERLVKLPTKLSANTQTLPLPRELNSSPKQLKASKLRHSFMNAIDVTNVKEFPTLCIRLRRPLKLLVLQAGPVTKDVATIHTGPSSRKISQRFLKVVFPTHGPKLRDNL